ncbi:hypothetical protein [Paenibacillus dokdonensis]|uniref:hypothetical protein n=1 Tax=Paenibacillus dokdonensis TaxID=2567944 RepID=UPI0010A8DF8C|nr:hypothetical protein [Paenibacillus dokdonensis]
MNSSEDNHKRIAFPISFRKRDGDLATVFSIFASEKGDRSEYARQLMRDGLRYRIEKGIPLDATFMNNIHEYSEYEEEIRMKLQKLNQTKKNRRNSPRRIQQYLDLMVRPYVDPQITK